MRKRYHEEHENHEAWAIPYGDLITLLLAFFVVMYAVSSLNEGKYRVLSDALHAEFRGPPRTTQPAQVGEPLRDTMKEGHVVTDKDMVTALSRKTSSNVSGKTAGDAVSNTAPEAKQDSKQDSQQASATIAASQRTPDGTTTPAQDMAGSAKELNKVADAVEHAMDNLIQKKLVTVRRHGLWVEVEIQTDILFPSGIASLSPLAVSVLAPLADALKQFPNPLRVEGHTDNVPINKPEFPSNWELSAARAASVVHLFSQRGVDPARLTVIGLGEYRPIKSNSTVEGRSANRRVVLVILGSDGLPVGTYGHERSKDQTADVPQAIPAT